MSSVRKPRAARGRTQKAMAVRIDLDLIPYLESQPNKAMAINKAIRAAKEEWEKRQGALFNNTGSRKDCLKCMHANLNTADNTIWCTFLLRSLNVPQEYCPYFAQKL